MIKLSMKGERTWPCKHIHDWGNGFYFVDTMNPFQVDGKDGCPEWEECPICKTKPASGECMLTKAQGGLHRNEITQLKEAIRKHKIFLPKLYAYLHKDEIVEATLAVKEAEIARLQRAVALLNCMVYSGEQHSETSKSIVKRALNDSEENNG